ncbi:RNA-directed DNA polymerase from mobile element jockey [Eumeta japonica]|uniref:RNA-directed DNA polymerase from mobile element jockey n=1 Tax=Eumeta variegata TaxID=151549 RepID=A0A4C1Y8R9_EUMVA|nr:RNA-directed DNA polymerase from mobile element jockey [Eumeta japonica]
MTIKSATRIEFENGPRIETESGTVIEIINGTEVKTGSGINIENGNRTKREILITSRILLRLPKKKAPGPDSISTATLRHLHRRAIVVTNGVFNGILRTGHFPDTWKRGKILERALLTKLLLFLIPRQEQYRFRSGHSTTLLLIRLLHHLASERNCEQYTVAVLLDMEKAFERVWHDGRIHKLLDTALPPALTRVIASFVPRRSFCVVVDNVLSVPCPLRAEVPQGNCLSPELYASYTDDISTLRGHLENWEDDMMLALYAVDCSYFASLRRADLAMKKS